MISITIKFSNIKGFFKKITGDISVTSININKKLYPGINDSEIYYPQGLKQLYLQDTKGFASDLVKNADTIKGIYKNQNKDICPPKTGIDNSPQLL